MRPRRAIWVAGMVIVLFITACDPSGGNNNGDVTGEGSIQAMHAMPELNLVTFLIEETTLASLNFKAVSGISEYDDLEYAFRFETVFPEDTDPTVLGSMTVDVDAETEYLFILAGTLAAPEIVLWKQFGRDWAEEVADATENETEVTVMEVSFGNLSTIAGPVDVYFESPGTSPLSTLPKATVAYTDLQTAVELDAGDYQLVLTPVGDPSTILFASDPISVPAATSNLFTVIDDGGVTSAEYTIRWIGTSVGLELFDINLQPELSAFHAALGTDAINVVVGGDLSSPLIEDVGYAELSPFVDVESGSIDINITPADNAGVIVAERSFDLASGSIARLYLVGIPGAVEAVVLREDHRRIITHNRLQIFQAAARFPAVDIYIVDTDVDITLIGPTYSSLVYGTTTGLANRSPGEYNLVVTEPGTKNILGGPYLLTLDAGAVQGGVILDSPSITATDLALFELE